jgi:GntR family transcriptional regulator
VFHVSPESGEPIYRQLIRQIKHAITTGALKPGNRLPTVRQLAVDLVINPNTAARAYRELERQGLVESSPRRGTFVKISPPGMLLEERRRRLQPHIDSLIAEAAVLGFTMDELVVLLGKAARAKEVRSKK